ncbi:PREDICTED: rho guanine nucleotide exchange factor 12 isoform X4 [Cercocebus atys]|nr:PREDICTED: rho guanine nucleotide exchange factor 12 isoform X4 [Cercocebus atys]XP_011908523.1 PREDICTED: rho guanine nucleotide exchange factor 12 isoform X4 [Cercocebus atys]XP_011908524.1 PREDICTED: rho guanine nucleotide exchange factor 12 isoform X4 [Cercocebus atys]XP_011908525.1 PREDICTED: rho guanine nucleotide exchange factor 12 isoform X4 [Cercocebus atys]
MRAGVQTGDRIIKVNGTLVTHSNHLEVVKLIRSGSYVALTVQGRPPGSPQIPLADSEVEPSVIGHMSPIMTSPHSPGASGNMERITSPVLMGEENNVVHNQKVEILRKMLQKEQERLQLLQEDYNRTPAQRLLKEIQEAKKHIPQLQEQLSKATGSAQDGAVVTPSRPLGDTLTVSEAETDPGDGLGRTDCSSGDASRPSSDNADSPKSGPKERIYLEENPEKSETIQDTDTQSLVGSPSTRIAPHIIGAEDDDFGTEHEQINGQCSCFQSIELLKSRPAHLAVFLHHVVSQFDPATLLCYLYSDLYKHTNSKETRRIFLEFHQFFLDRSAHLKVSVPDEISADLEKRRPELIPEDLHRHYIQTMQERVHPEVQRHLEDFRQKRSMGLTLAESELTKLDAERDKDRLTLEKERTCAEQIVAKIEEVLMTAQAVEEDKSSTMQYVILMYMKHLGVKVKEPRNLEHKRGRIGFLPKIKQSMKKDKEGEEKGKRRGFPSILGPPRRPSRHDNSAIGRAMELQKARHPKHLSTPSSVSPEPQDSAKVRQSGLANEGTDAGYLPANSVSSVASGASFSQEGGKENDTGSKQVGETPAPGDTLDGTPRTLNTVFDFPPPPLDQVQEEECEVERVTEHGTPKPFRKFDSVAFGESQSEDEQFENDLETDPPNWQQLVSREVLLGLKPCEIKRQEVINELFYTERAHVRTLKVLDQVFYQRVSREGILSPSELRKIFSNLEDILQLHIGLNEQMKAVRKRNETSVIDQIGEDLLTWFSGPGEEKLKHAAATFCSNQPFALEMIKSRQKKDSRFQTFVQDAESNPLCRRLQLKDIIPTQMQRLTKYPLLLDNIGKYTEWPTEREKVKKAADHCRQILNYVNQAVKEAENKQRLEDYQRRLDTSSLKLSEYPNVEELRNLDLTKRKMIHEGPLVWKVNRDKTIDLYTLLLEDILVLLQKQDDRLVLRCHSKILASTADSKHTFSPVIKLSTVLVRQVATDNKALFVISMSDNGAQIYELVAQTVSEKTVWQDLICRMAASVKEQSTKPIPLPQSTPGEGDNDEEDPSKLKEEQHGISVTGLQSPDRDLGLEATLISSKPQSHSLSTSGKSEVRDLFVAERQFAKEQHTDGTLKEVGEDYQITIPDSHLPVSEERWALDALRNLGLLKQLLVQQLGLTEKSAQEDWQHFPRYRTASQGPQTDSVIQNSENIKAYHSGEGHMPFRTGTGDIATCYSPRTSTESSAPRDSVGLAPQDSQASNILVMDHMIMTPEMPTMEPEGGLDDSGEHFFDAREAHSDENPSEGDGAVNKEEKDVNLRISGNYLILDGYDPVQESSTDEEVASSLTLQPMTGIPAMESPHQQQHSPQNTHSDGAVSPFTPEFLVQQRWGAMEDSCFEIQSPSSCADSQSQIMEYIHKIEADLEHLKKVEESYTILCQRLAGSALTDKHSDKS